MNVNCKGGPGHRALQQFWTWLQRDRRRGRHRQGLLQHQGGAVQAGKADVNWQHIDNNNIKNGKMIQCKISSAWNEPPSAEAATEKVGLATQGHWASDAVSRCMMSHFCQNKDGNRDQHSAHGSFINSKV